MGAKKAEKGTLYTDVAVILGSVILLGFVGIWLWLPNLVSVVNEQPFIMEMAISTFKYIFIPFFTVCFVFGELTGNLSQVDKIWPIITCCFCWHLTYMEAGLHQMNWNQKLIVMSGVVTIWAIRLTYQFYAKGGYSWKIWTGEEDYRWKVVRKQMPILSESRIFFLLFNFGFICLYQLLLLFLIGGAVILASIARMDENYNRSNISNTDLLIAILYLFLFVIEVIADRQQQLFQIEKYRRIRENIPLSCSVNHYEYGFVTTGLFSYSRHPNFSAEQGIWLTFYLFSVDFEDIKVWYALGGIFNISIVGALLLIVLFAKSTDLTEQISAGKYPLYEKYQAKVHRIFGFKSSEMKLE